MRLLVVNSTEVALNPYQGVATANGKKTTLSRIIIII